jgi:hypothetical protein
LRAGTSNIIFFVAQGMDGTLRFFATKSKFFRLTGFSILALLVGLSLTLNVRDYFFKFGDSPEAWRKLGFSHMAHAEVLQSFYPQDHIVVEGHDYSGLFLCNVYDRQEEFLTYQKVLVNKGAPIELPIRAAVAKDVVIFFTDWEKYDFEKAKIRRLYPKAVWKDYTNKFGDSYLTTVEIVKEDIQGLQKGLKLEAPLL